MKNWGDYMSHENIIRAWKDRNFRDGLGEVERSLLPENPAGICELTDAQLGGAAGGQSKPPTTSREDCGTGISTIFVNCPYDP
jgi:mersacidin/lichenicidin family type 2 lantibiotic